jgi:hypothetical protein
MPASAWPGKPLYMFCSTPRSLQTWVSAMHALQRTKRALEELETQIEVHQATNKVIRS